MMALLFRLTSPIDDFSELPENQILATKSDTITYLKKNFFKGIDLSDLRILRTPFLDNRMDLYFNTFVAQTPEEVTKEVFSILDKTGDRNGEVFKYLSLHFVNKYVEPKIMGLDRVFLNIYETYFKNKNYDWLKLEQIEFLKYNDKALKNNQVGAKAPNLFMTTSDEKRIDLYDIQAPYVVLVFWDPTCGHCTKEIPKMITTYNESWKQKGVKVFAINNNSKENPKWREFIDKEKLQDWINAYPPSAITGNYTQEEVDFQSLYNVRQTPVVFLLDKDKKIIAKKIGFENYLKLIEDLEAKK
jgi:peroxiredoxin